jgi:23S rRNA pseudouridine1911/1915/1917 synthase
MPELDAIRAADSSPPDLVRLEASREDAGKRIDQFLFERLGELSRMRIKNLIDAGCRLNGRPGRAGLKVEAGDIVELMVPAGPPSSMDPDPIPLDIIYEDAEILVVVKPPGMLAHPTRGVKRGTLMNALAYHLNIAGSKPTADLQSIEASAFTSGAAAINTKPAPVRPGLVHRLDRATSGLMVIAKTQRALVILSKHFRRRLVDKRYLALVRGRLNQTEGIIEAPIGRDPDQNPRWRVLAGGKPAETRFKVLNRGEHATLVELEPMTGRTNQLRIHLAFIGHPIIGDELYDDASKPATAEESALLTASGSPAVPGSPPVAARYHDLRLRLHALRLAFHHPATGEWLSFTSAPEEGFGDIGPVAQNDQFPADPNTKR